MDDPIAPYYAKNSYLECQHACQTLIEWHRAGIPWEDMAIAVCEQDTLPSLLPLTLSASGIPFMIGQESLKHRPPQKKSVKRRRIRTVIQNLILCASHITKHARKLVMGLGRSNVWRYAFKQVFLRFALDRSCK